MIHVMRILFTTTFVASSLFAGTKLNVEPGDVSLVGKSASQQLIVSQSDAGRTIDLTRQSRFKSLSPDVARVTPDGIVLPVGDGTGKIEVSHGDMKTTASVKVMHGTEYLPISFDLDVSPVLQSSGCAMGECHGKARGQNGFQLSIFGFDPEMDYRGIVDEGRGRRVSPASPDSSLLLTKGIQLLPHGGGKRLDKGSLDYDIIREWIASGMPRRQPDEPQLVRIEMTPQSRFLRPKESQQVIVTAYYSDGTTRDQTHRTNYESNESAIVAVGEHGLITAGPLPGEATIMARYMSHIATCRVIIPLSGDVTDDAYAKLPVSNFIDELVWDKLKLLGLLPSEPTNDAKFMRRVYIDVIGRLPTPGEVRTFLASTETDKRGKLIDTLLERPEYADHWSCKWLDLLLPNPYHVGIKATLNYDNWIRESFRQNKPYDQFVREIVSAQGSTWRNGAVTFYRDRRSPELLTTMVSQLFLGIRLDCARCHHHPSEKWGQDEFFGFAAYFAKIGRKGRGISAPISGSEEIVFAGTKGDVKHPITGEVMTPTPLFGTSPDLGEGATPREALARWITSDENPFFAKVIVNRVWADLMGRGLVEPVDDIRISNPATNEPLLNALADEFRRQRYDMKKLIKTIVMSHTYALSTMPNDRNISDTRNHSRYYRQRMRAEVLLDAVCDITDMPEGFGASPEGSRASQIWTRRIPSVFLDTFGRPDLNLNPPCERQSDTTVAQTLHLMNDSRIHAKLTGSNSRMAELAKSKMTTKELIEELYLLVYNRFPTDKELSITTAYFDQDGVTRRKAIDDLTWALLNTPEFLFKD